MCIIKDGETNSLKAQTPGTALSFKSEDGKLKYAADGPGSMWVHCVCIAFLLAVYLVHCAAGLFFKDPGKLPAGFEAAACMCSVFAGAAGMLMCGPAPGALPMFYTLLGAGMAALGASERFSLHRKEK